MRGKAKTYLLLAVIFLIVNPLAADSSKIGVDRIDGALTPWPSTETFLKETADVTGYTKFWVPWLWINPIPPVTEKPDEAHNRVIVEGIMMPGWHVYDAGVLERLDRAVNEAGELGLHVTLGIHGPPTWPRGINCEYDPGTSTPCGLVMQTHFETFRAAIFDFSYHMAKRYPSVEYWAIYNEPNLPFAFWPEKPYPGGSLLGAYMYLVFEPMSQAIRQANPNAKIVGPEVTMLNVVGYTESRWLEDWIDPILRDHIDKFDVLSVHTYSVDAYQSLDRMGKLRQRMRRYGVDKRVWVTEFNFGTSKEKLTLNQQFLFYNLVIFYSQQWWERSYFFTMMGHLLGDRDTPGFGKKKWLYYQFQKMNQYLP